MNPTLLTKLNAERFGICILNRLTRFDKYVMNLFIIRPFTKCTACKFRTVVGKDLLRKSSEKCNLVQYIDYSCSTERCVRLKSKTFTSYFIYYSENMKITSVCESIRYKVERPSNLGIPTVFDLPLFSEGHFFLRLRMHNPFVYISGMSSYD